jgi:hypothetical protein
MSEPTPERVQQRSDGLLPEERAAGTDDPAGQAEAILADSDARERYEQSTPGLTVERRTSAETVDPGPGVESAADPDRRAGSA